jgi:hypothetical protein
MNSFSVILSILIASAGLAIANPFEYRVWENQQKKTFEARIDRMPNSEEIVLQSKKGGMRHTVKVTALSETCQAYLAETKSDLTKKLAEAARLDAELIFKGMAIGLKDEVEAAARGKQLALEVEGFRISTDKRTATLELENNIFALLKIDTGSEFFEKEKSLLIRSTKRGTNYWWRHGVNQGSDVVVTKGDVWRFKFSDSVRVSWEMVGVTEGPVIKE